MVCNTQSIDIGLRCAWETAHDSTLNWFCFVSRVYICTLQRQSVHMYTLATQYYSYVEILHNFCLPKNWPNFGRQARISPRYVIRAPLNNNFVVSVRLALTTELNPWPDPSAPIWTQARQHPDDWEIALDRHRQGSGGCTRRGRKTSMWKVSVYICTHQPIFPNPPKLASVYICTH